MEENNKEIETTEEVKKEEEPATEPVVEKTKKDNTKIKKTIKLVVILLVVIAVIVGVVIGGIKIYQHASGPSQRRDSEGAEVGFGLVGGDGVGNAVGADLLATKRRKEGS